MQFIPKGGDDRKRMLAFLGGEAAQLITIPGSLLVADRVFPGQLENLADWVAKKCILPHYEKFDKIRTTFFKDKEEMDHAHNPEHTHNPNHIHKPKIVDKFSESQKMAKNLVRFFVPAFVGGTTSALTQVGMENAMGVKDHHFGFRWGSDVVFHWGLSALMPTVFSGTSEKIHQTIAKICQSVGIKPKDADDLGFSTTYVILPEMAGFVAGYLAMMNPKLNPFGKKR